MHFSFVSILTIFGKSDHLTLPQRQQRRPKLGEYFKHLFLVQKMSFFHIFFIFLVGFSNCNWLQSISEPQKPPSRPFLIENWSKNTKVMDFDLTWVRQGSQSMVSLEAKTITLVFFDQFLIKKGLNGGFWASEINWNYYHFKNPIKNKNKILKNYIFGIKIDDMKYSTGLGCHCWRYGVGLGGQICQKLYVWTQN